MSKRTLATEDQHQYMVRNGFGCGVYERNYYVRYRGNGPDRSQVIRASLEGWIASTIGWRGRYMPDPVSAFVAAEIEQWGA